MKVKGWMEINDPVWEVEDFVDIVLDKVFILDILDMWGVEYSPCRTGDFSQRAKCPLPKHLDGGERTASLFISEEKNSFYCYGCNSGGSVINFVELYLGKPFYESAKWLAEQAGITKDNIDGFKNSVYANKTDPEKETITYISKAGIDIRDFLIEIKNKADYKEWCEWANKRFIQLDNLLEQDDWESAKTYHEKLVNYLRKKQS